MFLADINLAELPLEALLVMKRAIQDELLKRKKLNFLQQKKEIVFRKNTYSAEYEEVLAHMLLLNATNLLSLPADVRRSHFRDRAKYLPCLLAQDWRHLFPQTLSVKTEFYVYAHVDPREGLTELAALRYTLRGAPFYIGKGAGRRAYDLKRNEGHRKRIQHIRAAGFPDDMLIEIIAEHMTEQDALILEAKLIYFFGSIYDESINGCLVNLADHIKPQFFQGMQKLPGRKAYETRRIQLLSESPEQA